MAHALHGALLGGLLALAGAPFQCAGDPDPSLATEEEPGEALWRLSEKFRESGHAEARRDTLRFLVERYPSSRFAKQAEEALAQPAPSGGTSGAEPADAEDD